jgi:hypothetical protein
MVGITFDFVDEIEQGVMNNVVVFIIIKTNLPPNASLPLFEAELDLGSVSQ